MIYWIFKYVWSLFQPIKKQLIPETPPQPTYVDKYSHAFPKTSIAPSGHAFVLENCPVGNVLMKYDSKKLSFEYYSDRVVPFRFLETIARKYAHNFHCADIYIVEKSKTNCNRYSYLGKLNNFQFLQKPPSSHTTTRPLSFAQFKKMGSTCGSSSASTF
jgi:hypothetical protein